MLDSTDDNYRDDQNIGVYDLVSQPSMQCLCTSRKVTVNNRRLTTPIDTGFCPFCEYHSGCHKTLNNHVRIHLSLSLFCGIGGCFFATSCCKALIQHAVMEHPCYEKSKELNPKKGVPGSSRTLELLIPSESLVTHSTTTSITVTGNLTGVDED